MKDKFNRKRIPKTVSFLAEKGLEIDERTGSISTGNNSSDGNIPVPVGIGWFELNLENKSLFTVFGGGHEKKLKNAEIEGKLKFPKEEWPVALQEVSLLIAKELGLKVISIQSSKTRFAKHLKELGYEKNSRDLYVLNLIVKK